MGAGKTYVQIHKVGVKDIFDAKYKSRAIAAMQKAVEEAVDGSSRLTRVAPKDKGPAVGYSLDASLVSLAPDKAGTKLEGKCAMVISSLGKGMKAMPAGKAAATVASAAKIDSGDVDGVTRSAAASAMKTAVQYMEQHAP